MHVDKVEYKECAEDGVYITKGKNAGYAEEAVFPEEGHKESLAKEGNKEPLAKDGN